MKRLLPATILFFLLSFAPHAHAAIAFDSASGTKDNTGLVTTLTWTHTVTGSNTSLEVYCTITQTSGNGATFSSATDNLVAMTQKVVTSVDTGSVKITVIGYHLAAPASGAHAVLVTISKTLDSNRQFGCESESYTGADQTGNVDSTGTNSAVASTATNFSVSDTIVGSGVWLTGAASEDAGDIAAGAAGANTTYRGVAQFNMFAADSNAIAAAGARSLNWGRAGNSGNLVGVTMGILPAAAAISTTPFYWNWDF